MPDVESRARIERLVETLIHADGRRRVRDIGAPDPHEDFLRRRGRRAARNREFGRAGVPSTTRSTSACCEPLAELPPRPRGPAGPTDSVSDRPWSPAQGLPHRSRARATCRRARSAASDSAPTIPVPTVPSVIAPASPRAAEDEDILQALEDQSASDLVVGWPLAVALHARIAAWWDASACTKRSGW